MISLGFCIDGLADDELATANTKMNLAAARALFNLSADSGHWLSDREIPHLISQRSGIPVQHMEPLASVFPTTYLTRYLFARHSLELTQTGGNRYYILNTDSQGGGFHWFVVAITYAPRASSKRRSVAELSDAGAEGLNREKFR